MCIVYKLWFVVNVHSTSCTAVCHVLLGYSIRIGYILHPCFYHFACAVGYVAGITIKVCALSLYILIV